jgi:Protein of unknown function (DUF3047)
MSLKLASKTIALVALAMLLGACSHVTKDALPAQADAPKSEQNDFFVGWRHYVLPGKAATLYTLDRLDGRAALMAKAGTSASMMRSDVNIPAFQLDEVSFSWQVPQLIETADLAERDADDSPVRVVLVFEGDKKKFSAKNAMLSELAQVLTGEPLPYATLMYVWCNKRPSGSVVVNPRTDRIRSIVVESGKKNLRQWRDYKRKIHSDFEKAFGEAPGKLLSVAVMTDSDNTKTQISAAYGGVNFVKK